MKKSVQHYSHSLVFAYPFQLFVMTHSILSSGHAGHNVIHWWSFVTANWAIFMCCCRVNVSCPMTENILSFVILSHLLCLIWDRLMQPLWGNLAHIPRLHNCDIMLVGYWSWSWCLFTNDIWSLTWGMHSLNHGLGPGKEVKWSFGLWTFLKFDSFSFLLILYGGTFKCKLVSHYMHLPLLWNPLITSSLCSLQMLGVCIIDLQPQCSTWRRSALYNSCNQFMGDHAGLLFLPWLYSV